MTKSTVVLVTVGIYFVAMILIGIIAMFKNKNASDYLVAGRKLNLPITTATLAAVQMGAGIVLGCSSTGSAYGLWPGMWYSLGCGGGLILAGFFVAKKLRQEDGYVPLDFFEQRYGSSKGVRIWAWISNVPSMLGIFIAQLLACGSILAGFGIPFYTGAIICAVVILIYSYLGGMWGVVLTDVVQTAIIMIGIPILAIASLFSLSSNGINPGSIYVTPFIPSGLFTKFIYLVVPFLFAISVSYDAYMRYQSAKDAETAKMGCIYAGIIVIVIGIFASTVGAVARVLHPEVSDGVFSFMVMETLNPVMAGIVISAVLAAAMSSANCLLVALGATFSRDFYNKVLHPDEKLDNLPRGKTVAQVTVLFSAVAGILLSFKITSILDAIIIFNYPYMGSLLIPLLAGILWKGATRKGAFHAMVVGGIIGVVSFLAGIPSPINGLINPDLGLFYAYIASLAVLYISSKNDTAVQNSMETKAR